MNVTQSGASRSRDVAPARAFFPVPVNPGTTSEPNPSASVYGWKFALNLRIWTKEGPKGNGARSVLAVLLWNSDEHGRTWLGVPAIMDKAGLGNERTARKALEALTRGGWIRFTPQTWSSLTAEQLAVGRKAPRRGDVGQAPNLYTVLDRPRQPVTPDHPKRQGWTRTTGSPVDETQGQICRGGREQIDRGGPGADLPPDPDPVGSLSRMESEQLAPLVKPDTPHFSKALEGKGDWGWPESWQLVVQAHASKTKGVYGLGPMEPDMKRSERKAIGECLEGASTEVAAKLRSRGMERELVQVRQDLAERAVALYFLNNTPHLRKTKHALRDLPREFHARITDAMQLILRESHDAQSPRQTVVLEQQKPVTVKAEKAAEVVKSDATEKLMPVETMREFSRRAIELVEANSSKAMPPTVARPVEQPSPARSKPVLPDCLIEDLEKLRQKAQEPTQNLPDELRAVQRSIGRPGAPRWGALAPTPTKIRRVSRLQLPEPDEATESAEPHPRE